MDIYCEKARFVLYWELDSIGEEAKMTKWWGSLICVMMLTFALATTATNAEPVMDKTSRAEVVWPDFVPMWRSDAITQALLPDLRPMFIGGPSAIRVSGQESYCQRYPDDCRQQEVTMIVDLTDRILNRITSVNRAVNSEFLGKSDQDEYGLVEWWDYPKLYGDCEDYALEKRRRLITLGISPSALLLTFVVVDQEAMNPGQKYEEEVRYVQHIVLTVRTNKGDLVLDNVIAEVLPWQYSPHGYLVRQSPFHAREWEEIEDIREDDEMFASADLSHG